MADNITLHTFDEIAEYFKNTPYGAKNKDNILVTHDNRVFIRTMIAMPGVNRHGWGMDEQFIPYNIGTIKGIPLTFALQKDRTSSAGTQITFPHPTINNAPHRINEGFQEAYIIGKYLGHEDKPDANKVWHGLAEVTNEKAKEYYGNLYTTEQEGTFPVTVSPQVLHYNNEENNRQALKRWWFQHVTITDDPAYPPEFARISSACIGTEDKCIPEIKKAGPDMILNEHQAPVYHVVDASNCPICVKDALVELSTKVNENSSLMTKSASFDSIMNNENNSGNTQTAGLEGNQTGGTNTQQTGALTTAQTVNEQKPTILPEVNKPEGGYSAELEVKNLPQVIEKIIQEQMAKYLNENKPLNVPEQKIVPKSKKAESEGEEEKKDEEEKKKDDNTPLTAREKALLERVTKSEGEVAKLAEQERKRGIELVLASVNDGKQFIDGKTKKFDDKKFQGQVDYWMTTKLQPEAVEKQIKTMIDLVGGLTVTNEEKKDEPQPNRAYASMDENKAAIYGVGDLNANNNTNQENVETKNASMSGLMVKEPYFIQLERRTVLRSDPIGQVE